ncbi:MAG TPA: hypothetical protein VLM05_08035, partial [Mycobacteriales bacterium]|nr:hypothetical protein [Mycobacteriales bacterium]
TPAAPAPAPGGELCGPATDAAPAPRHPDRPPGTASHPHAAGADPRPAEGGEVVGGLEQLYLAAFYGHPGAADPVLARIDPAGDVPARVRWLAGVCLGARGRYAQAARWLAPAGVPVDSAAASCLASHLRQVGRHADAEPLDRLALDTATDAETEADALVGLVADAVGRHDVPLARSRLATATRSVSNDYSAWRPQIRLAWVTAETALLASDPETAVAAGRGAERMSRDAEACRHAVKSRLVLGVALDAAGRSRPAARLLRSAATGADTLDLIPLVGPIRAVLATILQVHAPAAAERERRKARSAQSIIEVAATGARSG